MGITISETSLDRGVTKKYYRDNNIAPIEWDVTSASKSYAIKEQFVLDSDGKLYEVTSAISEGDAIVVYPTSGYNCKEAGSITEQITAKQSKTLTTPITVDGTDQTTVEGAIGAINTLAAANKSGKADKSDIAPVLSTAVAPTGGISKNDEFYLNNILYKATSDIAEGASIVTSGTGQNAEVADSVTEQIKEMKENIIYGFHIAAGESDPDKMVTYLADAVDATPAYMDYTADEFNYGSWKDAFFMPRPCMLKSDGTVDYYLNEDDYTKKEDGVTASDVANTSYNGNAMMEWGRDGRKIWYKCVPDKGNTGASVFIANYKADDDYVDYPFHNASGVSMPHFYTPIYNGSVIDGKMRSLSGQQVSNKLTATQEREKAQANNPTGQSMWDIECFADRTLINFLLILMSRSVDTQTKFGQGLNASGSEAINNAFRTGVHNTKGLFYGTNSGAAATYTNAVKVFGMCNWYGFQWRRLCGLILSDGSMKYKMTIGQEDGSSVTGYDTDGANYKVAGSTALSGTNGSYLITEWFTDDGMFPCGALDGQSTQYYCDACWYNNSGVRIACVGGLSDNGAGVGAFFVLLSYGAGISTWNIGAGLSCKPLA